MSAVTGTSTAATTRRTTSIARVRPSPPPSGTPRLQATPALVVATAVAPASSARRALRASQALGRTSTRSCSEWSSDALARWAMENVIWAVHQPAPVLVWRESDIDVGAQASDRRGLARLQVMGEITPLWLFGDQLGRHFHATPAHQGREVLLIESSAALARGPYHRQKLHLLLSGMRHLATEPGVTMVRAETYRAGLAEFGRPVVVQAPGPHAVARLVEELSAEGLVESVLPTPGFILPREAFTEWADGRGRLLMEDFYRDQRRRFAILLEDDGTPAGGTWNLDRENRERPPRTATLGVPAPYRPREDDIDRDVRRALDRLERDGRIHPVGNDGPRIFPVTHAEAQRALRRFLTTRLPTFGPHEDAMLARDWAMSHSL